MDDRVQFPLNPPDHPHLPPSPSQWLSLPGSSYGGRTFCRHHLLSRIRLHKMAHARRRIRVLKLAPLLDARAIQQATPALGISHAANRIDAPTWRMIAWALRMATDSLRLDQKDQRQCGANSLTNQQSKSKPLYHLQRNHSASRA